MGLAAVVTALEFALDLSEVRRIPSESGLAPLLLDSARLFATTSIAVFVFLMALRRWHPRRVEFHGPSPIDRVEEGPTEAETFAASARRFLSSVPKFAELLNGQLDETNRIGGESALSVLKQISSVQDEASRLLSTLSDVRDQAALMCGNAQALIRSSRDELEEMTRVREDGIGEDSQGIERIMALSKELVPLTCEIGALSRQTRLIALNASIQAVNDRSIGRGFVAVADEMRKLAVQIGSASGRVDEVMRQVAATVEEKLSDMVSARRIETERKWLHGLSESMSRMSGDFESAVFGQDRLSKECHAAVQSIFAAVLKTQELLQNQDITRQQIEQVQRGLALFGESLRGASEASVVGSPEGMEPLSEVLKTLEDTYTMRSQRNVHEQIVLERSTENSEVGPGIELF